MTRLPTLFFATAATFALAGMVWGIQMAATGDHLLGPAHGHLNLIGFVAMAIFGVYYGLTPAAAASRLATIHYALTTLTVLTIVPGIAMAITDRGEVIAQVGSILAVLSMALFLYMIFRFGVGVRKED